MENFSVLTILSTIEILIESFKNLKKSLLDQF